MRLDGSAGDGPAGPITAASFPIPHRVQNTNDPQVRWRHSRIAWPQAQAANEVLAGLSSRLDRARKPAKRAAAFAELYDQVVRWRYQYALRHEDEASASPADFLAPIGDHLFPSDGRSYSSIEWVGVLHSTRAGATFDAARGLWTAGTPTPASEILEHAGRLAQQRFDDEAPISDTLQNVARVMGRRIPGHILMRGAAAQVARASHVRAAAARGVNALWDEQPGQVALRTGTTADRAALRAAAFEILATLDGRADPHAGRLFADAAYCLFQGAANRSGGDACARTFLVPAHARVFGTVPELPQAVNLHAYVLGQDRFADYFQREMRLLDTTPVVVTSPTGRRPPETVEHEADFDGTELPPERRPPATDHEPPEDKPRFGRKPSGKPRRKPVRRSKGR